MSSVKTQPQKQATGVDNAQDFDLSAVSMPRAPVGGPFERTPALKDLPTLDRGDKGEIVEFLQAELREEGIQVKVDGSFGPATERAVKNFQREEGLTPDGVVGKKTWERLIDDNVRQVEPRPVVSRGSSAEVNGAAVGLSKFNDWRDEALKVSGNDPRFQAMMSFVRRWEGGYTVDHAGPTNYGITKPFYEEYLKDNDKSSRFSKSVKSLSEGEAIAIYHDQVWVRGGVGDLARASERAGIMSAALTRENSTALLGVALGNGAINYGAGRADRFMREAFKECGISAKTLAESGELAARANKVDEVLNRYLGKERAHYQTLGAKEKYDQYLGGWMNRHRSLLGALEGPLEQGVPAALLQRDVK
ncbi:MAG: hypothetical protein RL417_1012 [Pseudomonadota bacterium]